MNFDLNSRWAVMTEINQVVIAKKEIGITGKNKGKERLGRRFYYNNFEQALDGLIDRDINELGKLEEIVERITELKSEIKTMLERAKKTPSASPTREIKLKPTCDKGVVNRVERKKADKKRLSS